MEDVPMSHLLLCEILTVIVKYVNFWHINQEKEYILDTPMEG